MGGWGGPPLAEGLEHPSLPFPPPAGLSSLSPPRQELAKFQELIFEDFARFILVENTYEEVVLQSVMKDIMQGKVPRCWGAWSRSALRPGVASTLGWVVGGGWNKTSGTWRAHDGCWGQ